MILFHPAAKKFSEKKFNYYGTLGIFVVYY